MMLMVPPVVPPPNNTALRRAESRCVRSIAAESPKFRAIEIVLVQPHAVEQDSGVLIAGDAESAQVDLPIGEPELSVCARRQDATEAQAGSRSVPRESPARR